MLDYTKIMQIEDDVRREAELYFQFDTYGFLDLLETDDGDPVEEFIRQVHAIDWSVSYGYWSSALEEGELDEDEEMAIKSHLEKIGRYL